MSIYNLWPFSCKKTRRSWVVVKSQYQQKTLAIKKAFSPNVEFWEDLHFYIRAWWVFNLLVNSKVVWKFVKILESSKSHYLLPLRTFHVLNINWKCWRRKNAKVFLFTTFHKFEILRFYFQKQNSAFSLQSSSTLIRCFYNQNYHFSFIFFWFE